MRGALRGLVLCGLCLTARQEPASAGEVAPAPVAPVPVAPVPVAPVPVAPVLVAPDGGAPPAPASSAEAVTPARRWYGWQFMIADVAAVVVPAATYRVSRDGLYPVARGLGITTFLLSGVVIHAVHHRGIRAVGSLAARLLL